MKRDRRSETGIAAAAAAARDRLGRDDTRDDARAEERRRVDNARDDARAKECGVDEREPRRLESRRDRRLIARLQRGDALHDDDRARARGYDGDVARVHADVRRARRRGSSNLPSAISRSVKIGRLHHKSARDVTSLAVLLVLQLRVNAAHLHGLADLGPRNLRHQPTDDDRPTADDDDRRRPTRGGGRIGPHRLIWRGGAAWKNGSSAYSPCACRRARTNPASRTCRALVGCSRIRLAAYIT